MSFMFDKMFFNKLYRHSDITEPVFGISCKKAVTYLDAGKNNHCLDVFRPENSSESLPLIVSIHNECFIRENVNYDDNFCAYLASKGFCVISVKIPAASYNDYRGLVEDVTDAFIAIEKNASSFGADISNAFLSVSSTAANLALVSLCINSSDLLQTIYKFESHSLSFKAIGLSSPITEITEIVNNPLHSDLKTALFGDTPKENPYYLCSSFKSVMENSAHMPPMYIVSSKDDQANSQSLSLSSLCRKRNIEHKVRYCDSGKFYKLSHAFNVLFPEYAESMAVNNEMLEFFKSHM